jgi:AbrB family looped-hinge helix DNA binding protein
MGTGGRLVIPSHYRRRLGIAEGDDVIIVLEDDSLRIMTPEQAVRRAQRLIRQYVSPERRLSKELIEERRRESAYE